MEEKLIVTCRNCGKPEYYDLMKWRNGRPFCRHCLDELWSKDSGGSFRHWFKHYFPYYKDGKDYSKGVEIRGQISRTLARMD